jgi:hypothetical protein
MDNDDSQSPYGAAGEQDRTRLMALRDANTKINRQAWKARAAEVAAQKAAHGFGLAPAIGEDNDEYARRYNTD